jgi:hypothetical protein
MGGVSSPVSTGDPASTGESAAQPQTKLAYQHRAHGVTANRLERKILPFLNTVDASLILSTQEPSAI